MPYRTFPSPEPACCYIKPSIILCVGGAEGERFATEWLEVRLNRDVMANFREEIGQEVTHLVVPNDGESPVGQERAWLTMKVELQAHFVGSLGGVQL